MRSFHLITVIPLITACSSASSAPIQPQLSFVAGADQTDTVGKTLPVQLGAKLTDAASGAPLAGRVVNWAVVDGGGTLFVPVTQSGNDGVSRNSWTLGGHAGVQTVVARYIDPDTGTPITLDTARATALVGKAALLWANTDGPWPHPTGIAYSIGIVHSGQTFTLYYGFIDQFGNTGAATCGPVDWRFSGDGGFANDTVTTPGSPVLLPNQAFSQDFAIAGPGASNMRVEFTSCVPGTTGYIYAQPDLPVNYQP